MTFNGSNRNSPANSSVHYQAPDAHQQIVVAIRSRLPVSAATPIVIVCIGTDRSTGDALGPLVGMHLKKRCLFGTTVRGTLDDPVHAVNLEDTMANIYRHSAVAPFVIAVDACLGRCENIGKICVSDGPVYPGAGVNKKLLPIGDMNVTGIVNVGGFMEYSVLQNTRLSLVMQLSVTISRALAFAVVPRAKESLPLPELKPVSGLKR
ncbi:MAG: spore protease YyaC [Sporolactobacillus sp.]